jgi:hypothetical protein
MACVQIVKSAMELCGNNFGSNKKVNPIMMGRKVLASIFRVFDTNGEDNSEDLETRLC